MRPSLASRPVGTSLPLNRPPSSRLDGFELRAVTTPHFIGTKLEAFRGRGKGDFYASSDLEDIISVLDGRTTVVDDVANSPTELRRYIGVEVGKLLDNPEFLNALP